MIIVPPLIEGPPAAVGSGFRLGISFPRNRALTMIIIIGRIFAIKKMLFIIAASFTPIALYSVNKMIKTTAITLTVIFDIPGKKSINAVGIAIAIAAIEPGLASSHWLNPYIYPTIGW